jgi:hypothetical protein
LEDSVEQRVKKIEDVIERMNSRINTIVRNLEEQEQRSVKEIKELIILLTSAVEAMSIIRYYDLRQDTSLDKLEGVLSCLRRIEEIRQSTDYNELREYALERENVIFGAFLELAKHKNIAPNETLIFCVEKLGKNVLREIVRVEDISYAFGTDEALRWKRLLEL